ncbi:Lipase 3 [Orchesella cincta]|uniref:Lipase n=1 Tax=Orchesella cincta TaxID=48709 RepID=A0A1D2MB62_ORCCI|nr:Lipase 3 [Orchesella cincta]
MGWLILVVCQFVFSQRFQFSRRIPPFRACRPYQPLQTNDTIEPFACQRELALASNVNDPEADKSIIQISEENGYIIQTHTVTTSDGYILTLFRILGGRRSPVREGKPAVLILHGWGNSCDSWIALPNDKNLAFMLADTGYDVWLGCLRGTSFSLGHRTLNFNLDLNYWEFSFHEKGLFDFPAMVDHTRMVSGNEKIFLVAHSEGGSAFLVATSEIPDMNEKIRAAFLLAPAAIIGGVTNSFITAILPISGNRLQRTYPSPRHSESCNSSWFGETNLPRMLTKLMDNFNIRTAIHFGSNVRSCSFRKFDYGTRENFRRYRAANPPRYNLNRIQTPMYIFWAQQDDTVTPPDVQRLTNELPSTALREVIRVNDDRFGHTDFIIARDANELKKFLLPQY